LPPARVSTGRFWSVRLRRIGGRETNCGVGSSNWQTITRRAAVCETGAVFACGQRQIGHQQALSTLASPPRNKTPCGGKQTWLGPARRRGWFFGEYCASDTTARFGGALVAASFTAAMQSPGGLLDSDIRDLGREWFKIPRSGSVIEREKFTTHQRVACR
jgi:hypothetical protein